MHQRHLFPLFPSFSRFSCKKSAKESVIELAEHTLPFFKDNMISNGILNGGIFTAGRQLFDKDGRLTKSRGKEAGCYIPGSERGSETPGGNITANAAPPTSFFFTLIE